MTRPLRLLAQADVHDFHEAFGVAIGFVPGIRDGSLRASLIMEETIETIDAINRGDLIEAVDGLCDLIYVALGTAVTFGVDLEPHWREVHEANMRKVGGEKRDDGKQLKPDGWTPPDHRRHLIRQGWDDGTYGPGRGRGPRPNRKRRAHL